MNLDQSTWKKQFLSEKNAIILDVRTPEEFELSRIPNSKNIDFYNSQSFMQEIEKLNKDNSYYVYCRSGKRSYAACEIMKEFGFNNVFNLDGGFLKWVECGFEVSE